MFRNSATSFFQVRPERRVSAVKPCLPIVKKLIATDAIVGVHLKMEWDSTIFTTCGSRANFSVRVCLFTSRTADSANTMVACSLTGLSRKTYSTNGAANKVAVSRATIDGSPSLCNITQRYPSRRNKDTIHDVAYSLTPSIRRQVAVEVPVFLGNQDEQFVLCNSVISIIIVIFRAIKASNNRNPSQQADPGPLDQAPVATPRALMHASRQVRCWACPAVHVRPQQIWVAEPRSLCHRCLHPQSHFQ